MFLWVLTISLKRQAILVKTILPTKNQYEKPKKETIQWKMCDRAGGKNFLDMHQIQPKYLVQKALHFYFGSTRYYEIGSDKSPIYEFNFHAQPRRKKLIH